MVVEAPAALDSVILPEIVVVSEAEPTVIVSGFVLLVAILIWSPPLPVPILIVFGLLPVPIFTLPVVAESRVKELVPEEVTVPAPLKLKVSPPTLKSLATPVTEAKVGLSAKLTCPAGAMFKAKSPLEKFKTLVRGETTTLSSLTTATANDPT